MPAAPDLSRYRQVTHFTATVWMAEIGEHTSGHPLLFHEDSMASYAGLVCHTCRVVHMMQKERLVVEERLWKMLRGNTAELIHSLQLHNREVHLVTLWERLLLDGLLVEDPVVG